jgi:hypothetical protein
MNSPRQHIVVDVKYTANRRSEVVKKVVFGGLRLRESDGQSIMALRSPVTHKSFTVDIGAIEWIRIDGKVKKLRVPNGQHRQREAELRFLLHGDRQGLTDPFMRSYSTDEDTAALKEKPKTVGGRVTGLVGMTFMSLPGIGALGVAGVLGIIIWTLLAHLHPLPYLGKF